MFIVSYIGSILNLVYGFAIHHPAIYLTCIYGMCMNGILVGMKWRYENCNDSLLSVSMWDKNDGTRKQAVWHCELETIREDV